jgi:hypothetical protein
MKNYLRSRVPGSSKGNQRAASGSKAAPLNAVRITPIHADAASHSVLDSWGRLLHRRRLRVLAVAVLFVVVAGVWDTSIFAKVHLAVAGADRRLPRQAASLPRRRLPAARGHRGAPTGNARAGWTYRSPPRPQGGRLEALRQRRRASRPAGASRARPDRAPLAGTARTWRHVLPGPLMTTLFAVEEIMLAPEVTSTGVLVVFVVASPTCPSKLTPHA